MVRLPPRARDLLITVLDAGLIVAGSAALVIALGGRARATIAGSRIAIVSLQNPLLWSAVLALLRGVLGPTRPPLPLVHGSAQRFAEERQRFASPPPKPAGFLLCAVGVAVASTVWLWPHLLHPRRVPDLGDPIFSAWRLARFAHQLVHDPTNLFDGNIFDPTPSTLAYSDATVLQGVLGAPFVLAGVDPLLVSNAFTLIGFPLAALAFFYLGWRLTHDLRGALLIGLLGGLAPYRFEQYSHVEMQLSAFIPLAQVALLDTIAAPSRRHGALLGAAVAAQWLAGMYLGVMLLAWLTVVGSAVLLAWAKRPWRPLIEALAIAAVIVGVAFGTLAYPYLRVQKAHGGWGNDVITDFSAEGRDYLRPGWRMWASPRLHTAPIAERHLFPGAATTALAAIGLIPPLGLPRIAALIGGAVAFDWSLGRRGLTYDDLHRYGLAFRGIRVPARFYVLAAMSLVVLAAGGIRRSLRVADRRRLGGVFSLAVAAVVILIDGRPSIALTDVPRTMPPIYEAVDPSMVLAEFPMTGEANIAFMYFSTRHWARMLNGYSGFFPRSYIELENRTRDFPAPEAVAAARAAGATHLTFNCRLERRKHRCARTLEMLDGNPTLEPVASGLWENEPVKLYRFR